MYARKTWTPEDDALLTKLRLEGRTVTFLAAFFHTTAAAITARLSRLGVRRYPVATVGGVPVASPTDGGLAARIMGLRGLSPPVESATESLPEDRVRTFIDDPVAFINWLGVTLFDYQRAALDLFRGNDRTCLVWSRQSGKDHVTSLYALHHAITEPGAVVVCVSPSQRQSDEWMRRLASFVHSRSELNNSVPDSSQSEVQFSNGSRVLSLPGGPSGGATIRGLSKVSLLVFNEAAYVDESLYEAAAPFLATTRGAKMILISTPFGQNGYLWRAWNSEFFAKSHVTAEQCPLIPKDFLEKEKASHDTLSFEKEYHAIFLSAQDAYFPTELIMSRTQAYTLVETPLAEHAGMSFYLGADWARVEGGDRSVLTVLGANRKDSGKVLWIKSFEGTSYVDQIRYVEWLHRQWHFLRIYSDASAHAVNDELKSKSLPVEPVKFSAAQKVELYGRLKAALEADRLVLPQHPHLQRELSTFQYKFSVSGNLLLHHAEGGHDDFPDSLALAAQVLTRERRGKPGIVARPLSRNYFPGSGVVSPSKMVALYRNQGRPAIVGLCEVCLGPITTGQAYVGPEARRHARCPERPPADDEGS